MFGSFGQRSLQSAVPSLSVSVSATPQPQIPGATLFGSFGQPSTQSLVPSLSVSVKPGAVMFSVQAVAGTVVPYWDTRMMYVVEHVAVNVAWLAKFGVVHESSSQAISVSEPQAPV